MYSENIYKKFEQFLKSKNIELQTIDDIPQEIKLLIDGIGYYNELFHNKTKLQWIDFINQIGQFYISEEYIARPEVSLIHLFINDDDMNTSDIDLDKNKSMPFERFYTSPGKNFSGYSGNWVTNLYPLLRIHNIEFNSDNQCTLTLTYSDDEKFKSIKDTFDSISVYIDIKKFTKESYNILWFFNNAYCNYNDIYFDFPVRNYSFNPDIISFPYQYSRNYLKDYPKALDFLFELKGLKKSHFKWDEELEKWTIQLIWTSDKTLNENDYKIIHADLFKLNVMPIFHYEEKHLIGKIFRSRIVLMMNPSLIIKVSMGKNNEMIPIPFYMQYFINNNSNNFDNLKSFYLKYPNSENASSKEKNKKQKDNLGERYLEIDVMPENFDDDYEEEQSIKVVMCIESTEKKFANYKNLKVNHLYTIESAMFEYVKSFEPDSYYNFINQWKSSLKIWDENTIQELIDEIFQYVDLSYRSITLEPVRMQLIKSQGIFPVLTIRVNMDTFTPMVYYVLKRVYNYLFERSPLYYIPMFVIWDLQKNEKIKTIVSL